MSVLDKNIVLSLNAAWQAICHRTVKQALVAMNGGSSGIAPAHGMDIGYAKLANGEWDFTTPLYTNPVCWEEWLKLPVRDFDFAVATAKQLVRVPTVIISTQYDRMPVKHPKFSREAIFERDGGICQYTGRFVGRERGNLEHIVPRDRGGRDSFENCVWSDSSVNTAKANRLPHEAGLKLLRKPKAPAPLPIVATFREERHRDWRHFLRH